MLRIEESTTAEDEVVLTLAGRLVGEWVGELRRAIDAIGDRRLVLDVADVRFADRAGAQLLHGCRRQGAGVVHASPFLEAQLDAAGGPPEAE